MRLLCDWKHWPVGSWISSRAPGHGQGCCSILTAEVSKPFLRTEDPLATKIKVAKQTASSTFKPLHCNRDLRPWCEGDAPTSQRVLSNSDFEKSQWLGGQLHFGVECSAIFWFCSINFTKGQIYNDICTENFGKPMWRLGGSLIMTIFSFAVAVGPFGVQSL